jgi:hypothetical protein
VNWLRAKYGHPPLLTLTGEREEGREDVGELLGNYSSLDLSPLEARRFTLIVSYIP